MVWYSHLFKNFPQFIVVHKIKSFSVVSEAEVYVFLEFPSFSMIQWMLAILSLVPLPFLNAFSDAETGSKLGKEYVKVVCCHPAYLTYMQSTS